MDAIQPIMELSEEDVKAKYIEPSIKASGWTEQCLRREFPITGGKLTIVGNKTIREQPKRADYVCFHTANLPLAVIEAKKAKFSVSHGMQQAKEYAKMLDAPFAYSTNGAAFQEYDFLTGREREIPLDRFPTQEELFERYYTESNDGAGLSLDEERAIGQPYYSGGNVEPRYYQRVAINRCVNAIARGEKRLLLVMATGTGKTYTAFQIVWRMLHSGMKHKILYLADRNILVDQSIYQDFQPLSKVVTKVNFAKDDVSKLKAYQVFFALYQQMDGQEVTEDAENDVEDDGFVEHYKKFDPDFFDLIIVDECHRGSAKNDSRWRRILEYFSSATQVGMTATPKETKEVSNIDYFGEPLFIYSLRDGIRDGFLAPFRVLNYKTNIGDGWRPTPGQLDALGNPLEDREYTNKDFDYKITIQDRIDQVAKVITDFLKETDRMARTIVFCATEDHAERMRIALANQNSDMCKENPDYVVRITASDERGKKKLDYFISVNEPYPVIATTSELLTTGADCKTTKLIVLDKNIGSMIQFKQIIGRGTRIREDVGKTYFTILDFRNNARHFADPEWDGDVKVDDDYTPNPSGGGGEKPTKPRPEPSASPYKPIVTADGCKVEIIYKTVSVYDPDGKLLRVESITDYTKRNIIQSFATLDVFLDAWSAADKKSKIKELLKERGLDLDALKKEHDMSEVDDFDFICHVAYDAKPLTRRERANNVRKRDFLHKYQGDARMVLEALLDQYMRYGIYEFENFDVLKVDPLDKFGNVKHIVIDLFGSKQNYLLALRELETEIYRQVN